MTILELNSEKLFKVAGDFAVYTAAPFLEPMKNSALSAAAKYRGCKECQKPAYLRVARSVGAAFVRLTLDGDPAYYPALKAAIFSILNVHPSYAPDLVSMNYVQNGEQRQLTF